MAGGLHYDNLLLKEALNNFSQNLTDMEVLQRKIIEQLNVVKEDWTTTGSKTAIENLERFISYDNNSSLQRFINECDTICSQLGIARVHVNKIDQTY